MVSCVVTCTPGARAQEGVIQGPRMVIFHHLSVSSFRAATGPRELSARLPCALDFCVSSESM